MSFLYLMLNNQRFWLSCFKPGFHLVLVMILSFSSAVLAECQRERVKVQVLGSGGPEISDARASSSYLIWLDDKSVLLIDTGPGSSLNFERSGARIADLQAIAFSHFHVDHSADFPSLIKASFFTDKNTDLLVLGPQGNHLMPSTTEFVHGLLGKKGVYRYLSDYVTPSKTGAYKIHAKNIATQKSLAKDFQIGKSLSLAAITVHHGPIPALAWRVKASGCTIVFSGDMSNQYKTLEQLAKDADILIAHNAIPETTRGVARNLHMPPSEIGKIAARADVQKLVLSHRMLRTLGKEQETMKLIRKHYNGSVKFAEDLDVIQP